MAEDRYIEIKVKNIDLNIEKEIRFLLANKNKYLLDCEIEETDDECIFRFCSDGIYSFDSLDKLSKEDKYRLLVNIADMEELTEEYSFSIAPSNLVFDINLVPKVLVRDKKTEFGNSDFYTSYKALSAYILYEKYTYEQYIPGSVKLPEKSFLKKTEDVKSLRDELLERYLKEKKVNTETKILVKKSEYKKMKYSIPITMIIGAAILVYGIFLQYVRLPYRDKIISAYGSYISSDYIKVEDTLQDIKIEKLSKDVKYILARSYIFTEGLTTEQRDNLLEYTDINIDINILDFWIALGRCDFAVAEDIAKKIGNNEFLLFTYIKHSAYLKADVTITGEEKVDAINDLDKKIKELSESMEEPKQE